MTRTAYGPDEVYTRMAFESLVEWRWLSARSGLPIFHPLGVLFFFVYALIVDRQLSGMEAVRLSLSSG